MIKAKISQN